MAEARSAVSEPNVHYKDEAAASYYDYFIVARKELIKTFFKTRNLVANGLWPTSMYNLGVAVAGTSAVMHVENYYSNPVRRLLWNQGSSLHLPDGCPYVLQVFLISSAAGVSFFVALLFVRRQFLRILLSYRNWLYEPPKHMSVRTTVWGLMVKLVSGYHPTTYSCQQSLPRMPVPRLRDTCSKFLESVKPLLSDEAYDKLSLEATDFCRITGTGTKLQKILQFRSWISGNWYVDWWEKYVYLKSRAPLPINSNYYILDQCYWKPTEYQCSRAAVMIYNFSKFKMLIERQQLEPLLIRNMIPVCMAQYERLFGTMRIAGEEIDTLDHTENSKHIVVISNGVHYRLDLYSADGKLLPPKVFEQELENIKADSLLHTSMNVSVLSCLERTKLAGVKEKCFSPGSRNAASFDIVKTSAFILVLHDKAVSSISERAHFSLTGGDHRSFWFGKSLTLIIFTDGHFSMNCEHSWGDAPISGHLVEFSITNEVLDTFSTGRLYNKNGRCAWHGDDQPIPKTYCKLDWDDNLLEDVKLASEVSRAASDDLDIVVFCHDEFGKGVIKKCAVSPDAWIQLALHLTYYRNQQHLPLVYESAMTRLFYLGRTETVRALTPESRDFIVAMESTDVSITEKKKLLNKAAKRHATLYKDAMCGKGFDRHMFALYVLSVGLGYKVDFLKDALLMPWSLATSQQPQQQMAESQSCNQDEFRHFVSPGGGFGPVCDVGYGVSYMIPEDTKIFFHVSSKRQCAATNSQQFVDTLIETMKDMRALFEGSHSCIGDGL